MHENMSEITVTIPIDIYNKMTALIEGLENKYDYFYCQSSGHTRYGNEIWIAKTNRDILEEELRYTKKRLDQESDELFKYRLKYDKP